MKLWASIFLSAAVSAASLAQSGKPNDERPQGESPASQTLSPGEGEKTPRDDKQEPPPIPDKPKTPPAKGQGGKPTDIKPPPGGQISITPTQQGGVNAPTTKKRKTLIDWFNEQVIKKVTVTGSRRLRYQVNTVEGDTEAFNISTSYGLGAKRWVDVGHLSLEGRQVLGVFNFDANVQDSRFRDPQEQKFSLDYKTGGFDINLGDIQGRLLNTNQFATFQKSLRGASVSYAKGPFEARLLQTEVRGEARTISIAGANTSGPYYLQSSQIIRGSERIQVDGIPQEFGRDYTIDYDLGSISFVNRSTAEGKVIPPTAVIVATYETLGITGAKGRLLGGSAAVSVGKAGKFSATYLTQKSGSENRLSTRLESFQGYGSPGAPYVLQFMPMEGSIPIIRLDGILQVSDVDYVFDSANRAIFYFTRFVPSTSTVDVLYTPTPTSTVNGDREVVGLDWTLPLGRGGQISLDWARGRLINTPTPTTGDAKSVDFRWVHGKGSVFSSFRDVPSSFVGIETIGFNRSERTGEARVEYRPKRGWTTRASHRSSSIAQITRTSAGAVRETSTRFILSQASVAFTPSTPSGSPLELSQSRSISRSATGETQLDTTALSTARRFGRLTTRWELSNLFGRAPDPSKPESRQSLTRQGIEVRSSYDAGESLNATLSASLSRLSLQGNQGTGRDLQASLAWHPSDRFSANFIWSDSDAGRISSISGLSSGFGFGYDGNSFSSGASGSFIGGASSQTRTGLTANWRPQDTLSVGLGAYFTRSRGSVTSNTETTSGLIGVDWDLYDWLRLNGSLNLSQSRFVGADARSNASGWSFSLDGSPKGRFSFSLGASALTTGGGAGDFSQNIRQWDASTTYRLMKRHALSAVWSGGSTSGYLPQSSADLSLIYRYQIWQSLALNTSYRWSDVKNRDGGSGSGAYKARGFAVELAFNFGRF